MRESPLRVRDVCVELVIVVPSTTNVVGADPPNDHERTTLVTVEPISTVDGAAVKLVMVIGEYVASSINFFNAFISSVTAF